MKTDTVSESSTVYDADIDYEHEHRCAEHENDCRGEPAPIRAPEPGLRPSSNGQSILRPPVISNVIPQQMV